LNIVEVTTEEIPLPSWAESLERYAIKVLDFLGKDRWEVTILLCNNHFIKDLNVRYRNRNEATDVLSFEAGTWYIDAQEQRWYSAGDLVISLEALQENCQYFNVTPDEELRRLVIHGILHLNGMDHHTNEITEQMIQYQETILKELKEEHIFR
jgi:probable rRNA maturation factor